MIAYLRFLIENARFLAFGFLLNFGSSFGQTFYIAVYGTEIRSEFGLSHGGFGSIYSLATLASAGVLVWAGRLVDLADLRRLTALVVLGLALATILLASAASFIHLLAAAFALRIAGQGLMTHIAGTTMSRYFEEARGKALSLSGLGFPAGQAVFPLMGVSLLALMDWRQAWMVGGIFVAGVLLPLLLWMLKGHGARHARYLAHFARLTSAAGGMRRQWSRAEVLKDPVFYAVLPQTLGPPFILTGFFFHQTHLVAEKGWSLAWFAATFTGFSAATVVVSLASGPLIDRMSAARLLPAYQIPLAAGLGILSLAAAPWSAMAFMVAAGLGMAGPTIVNALWAELYGVRHLGAIRSVVTALGVFASALSPAAFGLLFDAGVSVEAVALVCLLYVMGSITLVLLALPHLRRSAA